MMKNEQGLTYFHLRGGKRCPEEVLFDLRHLEWEVEKEVGTHFSTLARESQGQRSLVGCCPWGHTESDTTEVT